MSVLTRETICKYLYDTPEDPLVITPLLNPGSQIGEASVDVRLGHEFIVMKRPSAGGIDPTLPRTAVSGMVETHQRIRVSLHEEVLVHPGQMILGATMEYVCLPRQVFASIEGRSSWGRLGLITATASSIAPGFKGCITLELVNFGETPVSLYPGVRIAQLIFHSALGAHTYEGKYLYPTGPRFSHLCGSDEMAKWGKRKG